jgi:hypothetical protein
MTEHNRIPGGLVRQPQGKTKSGRGLGRQKSTDPRDQQFMLTQERLRSVRRGTTLRRRKLPWHIAAILDQLRTNQCTLYAAKQQIQSAPRLEDIHLSAEDLDKLYREALKTDEFAGEADEGTSERAVQNILTNAVTLQRVLGRPFAKPLNDSFLWVADPDIEREFLATRGMLLQGTDFYSGMEEPDKHGYVEPTGSIIGGHEYVKRWYYGPNHYKYPDTYEYVNSWGEGWGDKGRFRMKAEGDHYLWLQSGGDLCSPVEPS